MKNRSKNYSYGDIDEVITNIQTGEISQAKAVHKYGIPRQTLAHQCKNKIENVADKIPGSLPLLEETAEKDIFAIGP